MSGISLRPVRRWDAHELIEANVLSRDYHAPWVRPFTDETGFESWFERTVTGANVSLIARSRQNENVVGVVFNISQIVLGPFRSAYLGFYGIADAAGQGFMTEALELTCDHAFTRVGLHRLEANIQPGNTRSIALVAHCGFGKEGFSPRYLHIDGAWRDHERWARRADK